MNAEMIADWASRKGFSPAGAMTFKKNTGTSEISMEIKKLSVVMILRSPAEARPRILTKLFKDFSDDMTPESFLRIRS
jgi:hypothetical protein